MISFIVPAHNEQACLPRTLRAIHEAAAAQNQPYEIVVVNDASTDTTAMVAEEHGARVVHVNHRQIAATRNSGGRAALGERFFFVDADTVINARAVSSALREMDQGAVGGGAPIAVEGPVPLYITVIATFSAPIAKFAGFTGGAFMFCTRDAFHATGGFDERLFWSEEGFFAMALKREGRFAVIWHRVLTSGRRFRTLSGGDVIALCSRTIRSPFKLMTQRATVEKIWYDSNRTNDDKVPSTLGYRLTNLVALFIVVDLLTAIAWEFVPWAHTPLSTMIGKFRFLNAMFLCHLSLLFWPLCAFLLKNLFQQKLGRQWFHSGACIAFLLWNAWGATCRVGWLWAMIYEWGRHWI